MSQTPSPRNLHWDAHLERLRRAYGIRRPPVKRSTVRGTGLPLDAEDARRSEWDAPAPGPLGRRLLADVEPYLEFFAIARRNVAYGSQEKGGPLGPPPKPPANRAWS